MGKDVEAEVLGAAREGGFPSAVVSISTLASMLSNFDKEGTGGLFGVEGVDIDVLEVEAAVVVDFDGEEGECEIFVSVSDDIEGTAFSGPCDIGIEDGVIEGEDIEDAIGDVGDDEEVERGSCRVFFLRPLLCAFSFSIFSPRMRSARSLSTYAVSMNTPKRRSTRSTPVPARRRGDWKMKSINSRSLFGCSNGLSALET